MTEVLPITPGAVSEARDKMPPVARVGSQIALVARTEELTRLREVWQQCRSGSAAAVLLPGEAGVGKTRLVCEFAQSAEAEGALVLTGHCVGLGEAAPPYLPVVEVLEQVREVDPGLLEAAPTLATLVSRSGTERDTSQLQLFDAFLTLLTTLAQRRGVLLVIEDLHWADASTRDLLTFVLARMADEPLTVVLTYRSDELHRRHPLRPLVTELGRMRRVERLPLEPFTPADARDFARALARLEGVQVAESLVAEIAERSEGNAFFAEELFAGGGDGAAVAGPLADVLLGRIERLGQDAQRVVRVASVAGQRRVRHASLLEATGLSEEDLDAALREAVQHYVLVVAPDETYEFRHSLLREAVYADLLPGERRRVHAAFVEQLGRAQHPGWRGAQAHHATEANDLPTALRARIGAASDAQQVGATSDVLHHLEEALGLWDAVPDPEEFTGTDELHLMIRAADAAVAAGRIERATAYLRPALALADAGEDRVAAAGVRRRMAKVAFAEDDWVAGRELIDQAWELVRDTGPSSERAWVLATLTFGRGLDDRSVAQQALDAAREVGDGGAEADVLISVSYALLRDGEHDRAMTVLDRARARARQAGAFEVELRAYFNLTIAEFEAGRVSIAAGHVRRGLQRARDEGLVWATYGRELAWMAVQVLFAEGAWDEVAELTSRPGEQAPDWLSVVMDASAAMLAASRGRWADAEARLASDVVRSHEGEPAKILAYAIAELGTWQHRTEYVTEQLDRMIDEVRASEDEISLSLLRLGALGISAAADAAARARQTGQAQEEEQALATAARFAAHVADARDHGNPRAKGWGPEAHAWLARARAEETRARGATDVAAWTAVVDAFGYGDAYQRALAQWRLAEALLAEGRTAEGDAVLTEALGTARRLGALPLAGALEAVARRYRRPVAGVRMVSADLLTPRERSVLELVARGLTNRAVGSELYISEKTVSVHLSRAMAKLGAHSRTEAVALALRDGLIDT